MRTVAAKVTACHLAQEGYECLERWSAISPTGMYYCTSTRLKYLSSTLAQTHLPIVDCKLPT